MATPRASPFHSTYGTHRFRVIVSAWEGASEFEKLHGGSASTECTTQSTERTDLWGWGPTRELSATQRFGRELAAPRPSLNHSAWRSRARSGLLLISRRSVTLQSLGVGGAACRSAAEGVPQCRNATHRPRWSADPGRFVHCLAACCLLRVLLFGGKSGSFE